MIKKCTIGDTGRIAEIISADRFQNVYLSLDVETYGIDGENIETYTVEDKDTVFAVIYVYYGSIQLFITNTDMSVGLVRETAHFITERKVLRVSGEYSLIHALGRVLDGYELSDGEILGMDEKTSAECDEKTEWAKAPDCDEIARLICADEELGTSYTYDTLVVQLKNRLLYDGCRNLILRKDGKIVSHFATFVETADVAILSGLITDPDYRGHGYGRLMNTELAACIIDEGKKPIIYCYDADTVAWYKRVGWTGMSRCSKLVAKK